MVQCDNAMLLIWINPKPLTFNFLAPHSVIHFGRDKNETILYFINNISFAFSTTQSDVHLIFDLKLLFAMTLNDFAQNCEFIQWLCY